MPSLLFVVFVLQLLIHLINTVGAPVITEFVNPPLRIACNNAKSQVELRREVVRLKREMNATSSQDEFAKWAKIRRNHDKVLAQYDEKTENLKSFKTTFDRSVTFLRWGGTNGLRFFLQFWYAKRPMFWIPRGWVPRYVEWILAFPRAPTGSVSIQIWGIACATVVQLVGAAMVAGIVLMRERQQGGDRQEKMAMGAGDSGGKQKQKKEL
ncbi:tail-anchored protein insertion receptor, partial [Lecanoromycetidae sp. Uapishka_2]